MGKEASEQKKKLSPDIVDDEDKKDYENKSVMEQLFGDDEIDNVIATAIGEDVDDLPEDNKGEKPEKVEESNEDDNLDNEPGEPEKSEQPDESGSDKDKGEEPVKLKLDEEVQKALSKYEGDLNAKLNQLVKSYNELLAKLQTYGTVQNVIKELGFEDKKPDEVAAIMKELKTAAIDMMNNPVVLDVLDGLAKGQLPKTIQQFFEEKTVSDFMPEGEMFDAYDSMNDPSSPSWQAREKWEEWKIQKRQSIEQFQQNIKSKKESLGTVEQKLQKANEELQRKLKEVEIFAKDEYDVDDSDIREFKQFLKDLPEELLKVGFAVFAKKKGIQSKTERKLKNKSRFIEQEVPSSEVLEPANSDDLKDVFLDWDANDDLIL